MSSQTFDIIIQTIIDRIPCKDHSFSGLIRKSFNRYVHLRSNKKDQTARRGLQSVEGLIDRRERWLLKKGFLIEPIYLSLKERLYKVL